MKAAKLVSVFALCFLCAGWALGQGFNAGSGYPMEFSIYGGAASSDAEKDINGTGQSVVLFIVVIMLYSFCYAGKLQPGSERNVKGNF